MCVPAPGSTQTMSVVLSASMHTSSSNCAAPHTLRRRVRACGAPACEVRRRCDHCCRTMSPSRRCSRLPTAGPCLSRETRRRRLRITPTSAPTHTSPYQHAHTRASAPLRCGSARRRSRSSFGVTICADLKRLCLCWKRGSGRAIGCAGRVWRARHERAAVIQQHKHAPVQHGAQAAAAANAMTAAARHRRAAPTARRAAAATVASRPARADGAAVATQSAATTS